MSTKDSEQIKKDGANRNLGDEWEDWDGRQSGTVSEGKWLFIASSFIVMLVIDALLCVFIYLVTPRLSSWNQSLPLVAWLVALAFIVLTTIWISGMIITITRKRNYFLFRKVAQPLFDVIFSGTFRLARLANISRDRMGHSFVRAYNEISRATKVQGRQERLLILLPRCLTKEQLKEVNSLKEVYPLEIHIVSGGELARKKIKEARPTAVIGVACERDLISGIRDVGKRLSLIGIPNQRPDGPCQNTLIDMKELIDAIEFYVGKPAKGRAAL
jgi:hypothetical protein